MTVRTALPLLAGVLLAACSSPASRPTEAPDRAAAEHRHRDHTAAGARISIERIAESIKAHVAAESRAAGGFFLVPYEDQELRLKLVRVHMEYLSDLGGGVQFACVDLADLRGDVFDVDFFLAGAADAMTVTETTVHKLNGQPFYAWEQQPDHTWRRIAVDAASPRELGVITGRDEFEFHYHAALPELAQPARMWLPFPESDEFQDVEVASINVPGTRRMLRDREYGNRVLFLELTPEDSGQSIDILYRVKRREKSAYEEDALDRSRYLQPTRLVPAEERFSRIAGEVLDGKNEELVRARALYDHVIDNMRYMKYGNFGTGDAVYACDIGTGNCTEYHSYFMALSRPADLPSRFSIGVAIPSERDEGGIDGYHCWAEFYAEGRWWPVDISEGDKYSRLATYYFGHHPANRFELSRGRDLVVDPLPASGPINFLAYPVLEIGGAPAQARVEFTFTRLRPALAARG